MVRSACAALAALWFAGNALWFEASSSEVGSAVTAAGRTVFAGLVFVALALVDWNWVQRWLDDTDRKERQARSAAERVAKLPDTTRTEPPATS